MVALATALGESEELRQRGRQGTEAQHGRSALLCSATRRVEPGGLNSSSGTSRCAGEDFVFVAHVTQTTSETSCNYVWWLAPRRLSGSNNTDGGLQEGKQLREPNMGVPPLHLPWHYCGCDVLLSFSCLHIWEGRMIFLNWPKWRLL